MAECATADCTREARAAVRTRRPSRDNVTTQVWWDDRSEAVPKAAEKFCNRCTLRLLTGLAAVLMDDDEDKEASHG